MKNKIGVYILTHNRLSTLIITLESILRQTYKGFDIIVSDNSENDETEQVMMEYLKKNNNIAYIHQKDARSASAHIQKVMSDNTYELYMLFHDDDEMLPNMIERLYNEAIKHPSYSAVAANAFLSYKDKKSLAFNKKDVVIKNGHEFISRVSRYGKMEIAPFPSYLYRKSIVNSIKFDSEHKGGKYCDISYLVDIVNCSPIYYVGEPLMIYNIHDFQDSASFDFLKHVQLTNYLLKVSKDKMLLSKFRIRHIYTNIVYGYKTERLRYRPMTISLFINHSAFIYMIKYLIRLVQSRLSYK